jgi:molecular chaperone GrpE
MEEPAQQPNDTTPPVLNELEQVKAQAEEFKAGWQRAVADYKNLQKEVEQRKSEWAKMSEQYIVEEFIPVYSNFKKAFSHHPTLDGSESAKQVQNWINGIGYIQKQFSDVLKAHGVEEIKTIGEQFDPAKHEAAGEEAADGKQPGEIIREVDGGYTMNGKIIKVAKVILAK